MSIDRQVSARTGVAPADLDELAARLTGPMFLPGQEGYDKERDGFERSVRHHPLLIVGATGADDVVAAVDFAGAHGLPVAVEATGHGASVPADGALLITTRRMTGLRVDPVARTARFEAGVLWGQVIGEAAPHGLAPLNGSAPFVGAVSYTLGGGLGPLGRRYGYAADHVRRIDVVTADGRLRTVSATEEPDLFWALRGGKGNFGVVTALEVDLMPVSRLHGGGLYFSAEATRDILHAYRAWTADLPDEMSSSVALIPFPDVPEVAEPLRGRFAAHVRVIFLGDAAEGERLVQPLRDVAPRLLDTVREMPYSQVASIHNDPPDPGSYYINSLLLRELDHDAVEAVLKIAGPDAGGQVVVELRHLGGALARPPKVPNAVAHRDAAFHLYAASELTPEHDQAVRDAHAHLVETMRPWSTGHRMLNFMAGVANSTPEHVRTAYTGTAYARLVELKTRYDPHNMFRVNHNIPPTTSSAATTEKVEKLP